MNRLLPFGLGLIAIVVSALIQGNWSERWSHFPELELFADQLPNVPMQIGEWKGEKRAEPPQRILDQAGAVGSLSRDYRNAHGDTVSVFLVCGRLQDMFYHEPKRCYSAAGFEMQNQPKKEEIKLDDGGTADFFASRFTKTDAEGKQDQMVYWSWCASGQWVAPDEPKWVFAGQRALYKLYVVFTPARDASSYQDFATDFIPELIPALDKAFEKATSATPPTLADN